MQRAFIVFLAIFFCFCTGWSLSIVRATCLSFFKFINERFKLNYTSLWLQIFTVILCFGLIDQPFDRIGLAFGTIASLVMIQTRGQNWLVVSAWIWLATLPISLQFSNTHPIQILAMGVLSPFYILFILPISFLSVVIPSTTPFCDLILNFLQLPLEKMGEYVENSPFEFLLPKIWIWIYVAAAFVLTFILEKRKRRID